ncbi:PREDICTED: translation initiation factor eIF-2B subunit delta-like isoform X2 [Ipomoea nil]|uniref:translation initiation factor eIF-2B subunit delta-like isoform X2 n=1 Tax=Ipomoea nil TaxID=35883 RepID=UPI000900D5FA|nr:PREDICTED: translation initiation factor eIF-2B subunit delta-like isoform X2 [Ipomoea nil]
MDPRRTSRANHPIVRRVGFFAPEPPDSDLVEHLASLPQSPGNTLSPVMIIPHPLHASDAPSRSVGLPVPNTALRRISKDYDEDEEQPAVGSYDASDTARGSSPTSSGIGLVDGEFSMDSANWIRPNGSRKSVSTFHDGGSEHTAAANKVVNANKSRGALERACQEVAEKPKEVQRISKPLKEKTSKAERRAQQEAQRAAKAASKAAGSKPSVASPASVFEQSSKTVNQPSQKKDSNLMSSTSTLEKRRGDRTVEKDRKNDVPAPRMQFDDKDRVEKAKKRALVKQTESRNRVEMFRHLPQYEHGNQLPDLELKFFQHDSIHRAVYRVGMQHLAGDLVGSNARCVAMLQAFREAIGDYSTPPGKILSRDLTAKLSSFVSFLNECRPLSISMGNAIRFIKARIAKLPVALSESEAKMILLHAYEIGRQFHVIIVDSRPKFEGQSLLRRLVKKGLSCTYTHINAVSYIMHEVTMVFLGAASVLSNGTVYGKVGSACVSMVAHAFSVPVLFCCEAYKFNERVLLDSICSNELGNPNAISQVPRGLGANYLKDWDNIENLQLLNLIYDATPSDYVSMIITDYGMIPTTSVPVIVREYGREHLLI